jgi:hypothetical protein
MNKINKNFAVIFTILTFFCIQKVDGAGQRKHFLATGPGAAASALGGSLVAKGIDATAGYYNPATLVQAPSSMVTEYAQPNIGAKKSWFALAVGSEKIKTALAWKNEILPLSSGKNAFLLSIGLGHELMPLMPKGFSIGVTGGYVQENIAGYQASATLASVGAAYSKTSGKYGYGLGGILHNIYFSGLKFREEGETETWPAEPEVGGYFKLGPMTLFTSAKNNKTTQFSAGLSYQPFSFMELRGGINGNPRFGIGFKIKKIHLDYTMTLAEIENINAMSLSYHWGKSAK